MAAEVNSEACENGGDQHTIGLDIHDNRDAEAECSTFEHDHVQYEKTTSAPATDSDPNTLEIRHDFEHTNNIAPEPNISLEGERLRRELIDKLVTNTSLGFDDFEGAVRGLAALKQARILDLKTGASWGVVRLFTDPKHITTESLPSAPSPPTTVMMQPTNAAACNNCCCTHTPLWRRIGGLLLCNACGIYLKNNGVMRDIKLLGTRRWGKKPQGRSANAGHSGKSIKKRPRPSTETSSDDDLNDDDEDDLAADRGYNKSIALS